MCLGTLVCRVPKIPFLHCTHVGLPYITILVLIVIIARLLWIRASCVVGGRLHVRSVQLLVIELEVLSFTIDCSFVEHESFRRQSKEVHRIFTPAKGTWP